MRWRQPKAAAVYYRRLSQQGGHHYEHRQLQRHSYKRFCIFLHSALAECSHGRYNRHHQRCDYSRPFFARTQLVRVRHLQ